MSTQAPQTVTGSRRVRLTTNLEQYYYGLVPGLLGWTQPDRPALWGVVIRFDNGCYIDTLPSQFVYINEESPMASQDEIEEFTQAATTHAEQVRVLLSQAAAKLVLRGCEHDKSKLEEPELSNFAAQHRKFKTIKYGTPEYDEIKAAVGPALQTHYEKNSHHPEHFPNGVNGMNLLDLVEMFCDWVAAVQKNPDGDIRKSIEINKLRFNLPPMLVSILHNTVGVLQLPAETSEPAA